MMISSIVEDAASRGFGVSEQTAFIKIFSLHGAIYLKKSKKLKRIEVSKISVNHPAVSKPLRKNGSITGVIDCMHPDALCAIQMALIILQEGKKPECLRIESVTSFMAARRKMIAEAVERMKAKETVSDVILQ